MGKMQNSERNFINFVRVALQSVGAWGDELWGVSGRLVTDEVDFNIFLTFF